MMLRDLYKMVMTSEEPVFKSVKLVLLEGSLSIITEDFSLVISEQNDTYYLECDALDYKFALPSKDVLDNLKSEMLLLRVRSKKLPAFPYLDDFERLMKLVESSLLGDDALNSWLYFADIDDKWCIATEHAFVYMGLLNDKVWLYSEQTGTAFLESSYTSIETVAADIANFIRRVSGTI